MWAMRIALAVVGAHSLSRTIAYIGPFSPDQRPAQLEFLDQSVPLWVYAMVWALGGALAFPSILVRLIRPYAIGVNAGMNMLWGIAFLLAWIFLDQPRAWVTAISSITIGALILCIGALKEGSVVVVNERP